MYDTFVNIRERGKHPLMATSEIARFRQQQALQEEAARQALYGLAAVASHETITARMEQETPYLLSLLEEGKLEQA